MAPKPLDPRLMLKQTVSAALTALFALVLIPSLALAQTPEIELLEHAIDGVDRYTVHILPGTSLWAVATERLALKALDEGHGTALQLLQQSFERAFPGRQITELYPGESFILEVPAGTFVTQDVDRTPDEVRYTSFHGDELVYYARDPYVTYRLTRASTPEQSEVLVASRHDWFLLPDPNPVQLASRVYQVEQPDFLQVRWIREVLRNTDRAIRLTVDTERRHLDDFRNYRARAVSVEPDDGGMTVYTFSEAQIDIPFIRVEDAVGDEVDPARFPRLFRVEYYKDGTIRRFLITQPGDLLAALRQPDNDTWGPRHKEWRVWDEGQASALEPFAPAVTEVGSLTPGRILVLTHAPRPSPATSGLECFGIPLLVGGGLVLGRIGKRVRESGR